MAQGGLLVVFGDLADLANLEDLANVDLAILLSSTPPHPPPSPIGMVISWGCFWGEFLHRPAFDRAACVRNLFQS